MRAIGFEVRGVRLLGKSAESMAPALDGYAVQASLTVDIYCL